MANIIKLDDSYDILDNNPTTQLECVTNTLKQVSTIQPKIVRTDVYEAKFNNNLEYDVLDSKIATEVGCELGYTVSENHLNLLLLNKQREVISTLPITDLPWELADVVLDDDNRCLIVSFEGEKEPIICDLSQLYAHIDDIRNDLELEVLRATSEEERIENKFDNIIDNLDLNQVGSNGKYIKVVSQENGQVSATEQTFDTDMQNATDDNAPTTLNVKNYVDAETIARQEAIAALDAASVGQDGSYLKTIVENDGIITATTQDFDTTLTNATNNNAPTTKLLKDTTATITSNLNQEISDRGDADTALDNRITTIENDYLTSSDKTELQTAIGNEITRAEGEESRIEGLLTDEITRATGIENDLDARLDLLDTAIQVDNSGNLIGKNNTTIMGDLTVKGTTTTVDQETIQAKSNLIVTNSTNAPLADVTGIVALTGDYAEYDLQEADYKANTYYYEYETDKYKLDDSPTFTQGRQYYVAKAEGVGVYDPSKDALLLGEGKYIDGNFTFDTNQGQKIATRGVLVDGRLVKWDDINHTLVDTGDILPSNATANNKLATQKTVTDAINALDVEITVGKSYTLNKIYQTNGKISTTIIPIQITENQVTNLISDLASKQDNLTFATNQQIRDLFNTGYISDNHFTIGEDDEIENNSLLIESSAEINNHSLII